jgi:hypothetical protein
VRCPKNAGTYDAPKRDEVEDCMCLPGYYTKFRKTGTDCEMCPLAENNNPVSCPQDMYMTGNIIESCIGGLCPGGTEWPIAKNGSYLQFTNEREFSVGILQNPVFFWCPLREACLGNNTCRKGHKGIQCRECEPYHYQQRSGKVSKRTRTPTGVASAVKTSPCTPCGDDSLSGLLWICVAFAGLIGLFTFGLYELVNFQVYKDQRVDFYSRVRGGCARFLCFPLRQCVRCFCQRRHDYDTGHMRHSHYRHTDEEGRQIIAHVPKKHPHPQLPQPTPFGHN